MGMYQWIVFIALCGVLVVAQEKLSKGHNIQGLFPVTLIHINDFHARFEETNIKSNPCTTKLKSENKCIAGIARVYHMIKHLLKQYENKNAIYLNVGDNFQGTLWYNLLRWNVTAHFIKLLKPAVMTLGNHEFDHTPKGLKPYLDALNEAEIPTVVANLNTNGDEHLSNSKIYKTKKISVSRKKIGIIGVLYDKTHEIAQTGKVTLSSAIEEVKQKAISLKNNGVNMIVVLSHCSLDEDKKIAKQAGEYIDVIVGAHSHSFLYSKDSGMPYDSNDNIEGEYPVIVTSTHNRKIPIVQAKAYGKYVGRLTLYFDDKGEVKFYEGYPVYINNSVPQDPDILEEMKPWRAEVQRIGSAVVGHTNVFLDRESCRNQECTLGVVVADAFANQYTNETFRPIAIVQAGNFRNPIAEGDITNGDIIEAAPYGSTVDLIKLKGEDIWSVAEHSFALDDEGRTNCLQVAGLHIVIDPNRDFYSRVLKIEIRDYSKPHLDQLTAIDKRKEYYVATTAYLADGKDGFVWMKNATARWSGPLDSDVFKDYITKIQTVNKDTLKQGRVQICGKEYTSPDCKSSSG